MPEQEVELKDITGAVRVEILIDTGRRTVWVNTEKGCVLRICQITGAIHIDGTLRIPLKKGERLIGIGE